MGTDDSEAILRREEEYWENKEEFDWLTLNSVKRILEKIGAPKGRVLELCIGSGMFTRQMDFSNVGEYIGLDLSSRLLQKLKIDVPQIKIKKGDAQKLSFPDKYFNEVRVFAGLHHLPKMADALNGCFSVLKNGGMFFCFEPNDNLFYRSFMFRFFRAFSNIYTKDEAALNPANLVNLLQTIGFKDVKIEYVMPNYKFLGKRFFLIPFFVVMKSVSFIPLNSTKPFFIITCKK